MLDKFLLDIAGKRTLAGAADRSVEEPSGLRIFGEGDVRLLLLDGNCWGRDRGKAAVAQVFGTEFRRRGRPAALRTNRSIQDAMRVGLLRSR